jgi:hypothetical protein
MAEKIFQPATSEQSRQPNAPQKPAADALDVPFKPSLPVIPGVFAANFAKRVISPGTLTTAAITPAQH